MYLLQYHDDSAVFSPSAIVWLYLLVAAIVNFVIIYELIRRATKADKQVYNQEMIAFHRLVSHEPSAKPAKNKPIALLACFRDL